MFHEKRWSVISERPKSSILHRHAFLAFSRQFDLIHFKRETQDFTFFHYIHVISLHSVAIASVSPKS